MKAIAIIIVALFSSVPFAVAEDLDTSSAQKYAVFAMMSSNAYLDKDRTYFPIEELGWVKVDRDGNPTQANSYTPGFFGRLFSNLQYDIWINRNNNEVVFAFKGTDEKIDWLTGDLKIGVSIPYKSAKKHVKKYIKKNPNKKIMLTGHSLGGGLALSVSLWEGIDAFVFNTSPRVFDGIMNHKEAAVRKAIYQEGDILQKIRQVYPKFLETIPSKDIIKTNFTYGEESNHRSDLLAEGLLRCAKEDPSLVELAQKIPKKVACNF